MPMRKIRDVLRLSAEGLSTRQIAASLAIGRTTLRGNPDRAAELGLSRPLPPKMSDTDLERRLFDRAYQNTQRVAAQPNRAHVHRELRSKGVTLALL
ncbi:MAG: transposase [Paracoccaceae bacterium]|jgi:transposase